VSIPVSLLRHAAALGLGDGHVRLLLVLETCRRGDGDEAVWMSQPTLAKLCDCSVDTIQRRDRQLRDRGLIEVVCHARRPGGKRVNHYTRRGLGVELARLEAEATEAAPVRPTDTAPVRPTDTAPVRPEVEAVVKQKQGSTHSARATQLAPSILDLLNTAGGTSFGAAWRDLIADRVDEHPDVDLDDYRAMIATAFRPPRWWGKGPFSPRVLFSSDQFEIARQGLRSPGASRSAGQPKRYTRED
jgi:hypothetical protein